MLFLGEFYVSFSGPNRLVVPKKIREALGTSTKFTLSKGFNTCLSGFRDKDWQEATKNMLSTPTVMPADVDLKRHIFSSASQQEIDKQGRIIVPPGLLEYAGLEGMKEAVIIGVGDHFEIWESTRWKKYLESIEKVISEPDRN